MLVCKLINGLELSHQDLFLEKTECCKCGKVSRFAFVAYEVIHEDRYISSIHENGNPSFWPHDAIAVAVYFCTDVKCATATTLWNQA